MAEVNKAFFQEVIGSFANVPGKAHRLEDGTWVNALGLTSSDDFHHVSSEWTKHCIPFTDFHNDQLNQQQNKKDEIIALTDVQLNFQESRVVLVTDNGEYKMTDNAIKQLTRFSGVPEQMSFYLMEIGTEESLYDLIKYHSEGLKSKVLAIQNRVARRGNKPSESILARLNTASNTVRGLLTDKYSVINNSQVTQLLYDTLPAGSQDICLASHLFDSTDTITGNILIPDRFQKVEGDESDWGIGIQFINDETGKHVFHIQAFLFRAICSNGCIWARQDSKQVVQLRKKHFGELDWKQIYNDTELLIYNALSNGEKALTQMLYTRDFVIDEGSIPGVIAYLADENSLPMDTAKRWLKAWHNEPLENAFGIVNAATRAAQVLIGNERTKLETIAGDIISPSIDATKPTVHREWEKIVIASERVKEKKLAVLMN